MKTAITRTVMIPERIMSRTIAYAETLARNSIASIIFYFLSFSLSVIIVYQMGEALSKLFFKNVAQISGSFFVQYFCKLVLTKWRDLWYNWSSAEPRRPRPAKTRGLKPLAPFLFQFCSTNRLVEGFRIRGQVSLEKNRLSDVTAICGCDCIVASVTCAIVIMVNVVNCSHFVSPLSW